MLVIKSYGQRFLCKIVKGSWENFRGRMGEIAFTKFCANAFFSLKKYIVVQAYTA